MAGGGKREKKLKRQKTKMLFNQRGYALFLNFYAHFKLLFKTSYISCPYLRQFGHFMLLSETSTLDPYLRK